MYAEYYDGNLCKRVIMRDKGLVRGIQIYKVLELVEGSVPFQGFAPGYSGRVLPHSLSSWEKNKLIYILISKNQAL